MADAGEGMSLEGVEDPQELKKRAGIRDNHLRELEKEVARLELVADEARSAKAAAEERAEELRAELTRLRERLETYEEEERARRKRRGSRDREVERLERQLEHREGEVSRLKGLVEQREQELEELESEASGEISQRDRALEEALRRVEGLENDLEERESEVSELRGTIDNLQERLEQEYDLRRRLAEPANRLRTGIDLFNDSEHLESVSSVSRSLGQPEVYVELEDGREPAALLTFTWRGISWRTYAANPSLEVEEPRVYLLDSGENLSGVDPKSPNARLGPGGRVRETLGSVFKGDSLGAWHEKY
jgi:chromosome segregation ATPase